MRRGFACPIPLGLCPACLLAQGAAGDTVTGGDAAPFTPPAIAELTPLFPSLDLLELIGHGGMGAVYRARQKELDRIVALKILPPGIGDAPGFAERFAREAKALARLNHPGIVTIHDFGRADGLYFFLMEFVDGVNLRQLLHGERIAPREALAIVPQICDALQFAHDHGIVHRDIKPENILMDRRGRVKVADFGVAKLVAGVIDPDRTVAQSGTDPSGGADSSEVNDPGYDDHELTEAGKIMGTPSYMAPEQTEHPDAVDHRADIYALGVVFYQMLTGELPEEQLQPPSRKVRIDVRLDEVVLRALEKEPELRYQQASILKTRVEEIASEGENLNTAPLPSAASGRLAMSKLRRVHRQVRWPATGLLVTASISPFLPGLMLMAGKLRMGSWVLLPLIFVIAATVVVVIGSLQMRRLESRRLALAGAICGCVLSFFNLFCLPFAAWSLAVLLRREVREGFDLAKTIAPDELKPSGQPPKTQAAPVNQESSEGREAPMVSAARFSRAAIVSTCWAAFFFVAGILFFWATALVAPSGITPPEPPRWQIALMITVLPLGVTAPLGTTILGWVAITQIRRSTGELYGLGLAVFDGLLFPLLALDYGIAYVLHEFGKGFLGWSQNYDPVQNGQLAFTSCLLWAVFDSLIVRRVWRAVQNPVSLPDSRASDRPRGWFTAGKIAAVILAMLFLLPAVAILLPELLKLTTRHIAHAEADFHYQVFEADAALVDRLVPPGNREPAISSSVKPLMTEPAGSDGIVHDNAQLAAASVTALETLRQSALATPPGLLADRHRTIGSWPAIADTWSYSRSDAEAAGGGSGSGFLGFREKNGGPMIRIEYVVQHSIDRAQNHTPRSTRLLCERIAPEENEALVFLMPFERADATKRYLVIAFEIATQRTGPEVVKAHSRFPRSAHLHRPEGSVLVHHDEVEAHYTLFFDGDFSSSVSDQHNTHSLTWMDRGTVTLPNGRTFGYLRESVDDAQVGVNGRAFALREGRVLVLRGDGTVEQAKVFPTLAEARDPAVLAKLVAGPPAAGQFGPVIERELSANDKLDQAFLDLDRGAVLSAPKELVDSLRASHQLSGGSPQIVPELRKWMRECGADVIARTGNPSAPAYLSQVDGFGPMISEKASARGGLDFDSISSEALSQWLEASEKALVADQEDKLWFLHPGTVTAFKSREGKTGLLEIVSAQPDRVKVRYKVLETRGDPIRVDR